MKNNKCILHINCNYIGTTLHQTMIEYLDKLDYYNEVFVPTYDKDLSVIVPNENVCVCECFHKWDRIFFNNKQRKICRELENRIVVNKFNLIHAYTLFTDGNCARMLSKRYAIPYVVAIRNTDVNVFFKYRPYLRKRGIQIMKDAAAVFFLSDAYRKQVFDKYIPKELMEEINNKSFIIPNGIDEFWFKNKNKSKKTLDKSKIKLIFVGKINKNKNIVTIQKAMDILVNNGYGVELKVVGKVQDKKVFREIQNNSFTIYYPPMTKEKLIEQYRLSDIYVMPSITESFGLVYAEAMSQGLPVIYSKGQGFDDQFEEGKVGSHVLASSPEDVAEGIERVINNYSFIQKNVVELVEKFSWKKIVEKYDEVYEVHIKRNV